MQPVESSEEKSRRETLNIRIRPEERSLIDRAAQAQGKNRTDFILEAARRAAEDALLDLAIIAASPEAYAAFLARLDSPPMPNERLRRTLRTPAPWDGK
ncbi:type II toxin-antitoxin system TacA family antitoxin [Azospirillum endophyticum]